MKKSAISIFPAESIRGDSRRRVYLCPCTELLPVECTLMWFVGSLNERSNYGQGNDPFEQIEFVDDDVQERSDYEWGGNPFGSTASSRSYRAGGNPFSDI